MRRHVRVMDPTIETDKHVRDALGYVPQREMTRAIDEGGKSSKTTGLAVQVGDRLLSREIRQVVFANGFSGTSEEERAFISMGPFTGRIETAGPKPIITLLAAAGSTATALITGNDISGQIEVVPGGVGIAVGSFITVTFFAPYPSATYDIQITENSSAARSLTTGIGPVSRTSTSFNLDTRTALTSGSTYQWGYLVIYRRANV